MNKDLDRLEKIKTGSGVTQQYAIRLLEMQGKLVTDVVDNEEKANSLMIRISQLQNRFTGKETTQ